jgi:hypothetical protein
VVVVVNECSARQTRRVVEASIFESLPFGNWTIREPKIRTAFLAFLLSIDAAGVSETVIKILKWEAAGNFSR